MQAKVINIKSPSCDSYEWSYDALTRSTCLNVVSIKKSESTNSILNLLNTYQFSPISNFEDEYENEYEDEYQNEYEDETSLTFETLSNIEETKQKYENDKKIESMHRIYLMAGSLLLCISGILDAANIAYINWLNDVGFNINEILIYQGIVQVLLCFFFAIITAKIISNINLTHSNLQKLTFISLILPFYMEYNINFINLFKRNKKKIMDNNNNNNNNNNYGSIITKKNENNIIGIKQLLISIFVFGIIQFGSHIFFFNGYLEINNYEIAPLFNSLSIGFVFIWLYFINKINLNSEIMLYLFLMYTGIFILGYSFIKYSSGLGFKLLLTMSNIYLILSALFESFGYILIKICGQRVPTFVFVFSQSIFCAILGLVLFQTSHSDFIALNSFSDLIEISSVGFIGFLSTWTFVRGTQLISIGIASFLKMTIFIIFSIIIQVFSIENKMPHFYCIFGIALIVLSIILMLIFQCAKKIDSTTSY